MAKQIGIAFGIVFLVFGILGFINNPLVGTSDSVFATNTAHDLVHVITGLLFIILAVTKVNKVGITLKTFGVIYLALAIIGLLTIDTASGTELLLGVLEMNHADNWLHVALAILVFAGGVIASKENTVVAQAPQVPTMTM